MRVQHLLPRVNTAQTRLKRSWRGILATSWVFGLICIRTVSWPVAGAALSCDLVLWCVVPDSGSYLMSDDRSLNPNPAELSVTFSV